MTSMIRLAIASMLLYSCSSFNSSIDYGYFRLFYEGFRSNEIIVTDEVINSIPYSFVRIKQASREAIFVLSSIDNELQTWVGPNNEKIFTFKGLIIETNGLNKDVAFNRSNLLEIYRNFPNGNFVSPISFFNPNLINTTTSFEIISKKDKNCPDRYIEYKRTISVLKSENQFKFCFDEKGNINWTKQRVHELDKEMLLEFYYKY